MIFEFDGCESQEIIDFVNEYVEIRPDGSAYCDLRFSKYIRFDDRHLPYLQVYFKTLKKNETENEI